MKSCPFLYKFLPLVFVLIALNASSQIGPDPLQAYNKNLAERWNGQYIQVSQYRVKGSPFFGSDAFPGQITYADGRVVSYTKIRYDLHRNVVEVERDSTFYEMTVPIKEFRIRLSEEYGNKELTFRQAKYFGEKNNPAYYSVIDETKNYSFVKEFKLKLTPDYTNQMAKDYKLFEMYYEYYLYNDQTKAISKVKLNKKSISGYFKDNAEAVERIKTNTVNVSNEAGIIILLGSL